MSSPTYELNVNQCTINGAQSEHGIPVIFDLETTGLNSTAEILQISAKYHNLKYNNYILPSGSIPGCVTEITGLSVVDGRLILRNKNGHTQTVQTVPVIQACKEFISYLKNVSNTVILVAHNGVRFDAPLIIRAMKQNNLLNDFKSVVKGFVDSITVFKNVKELKSRQFTSGSFKLTVLADLYLEAGSTENAHNAVADVYILNALLSKFSISEATLNKFTVPFERIPLMKDDKKKRYKEILDTFTYIKGRVAASTICKLASAGITLKNLQDTFVADGEAGICKLLGEDIGGKPKVTNNEDIQRKLCIAIRDLVTSENIK